MKASMVLASKRRWYAAVLLCLAGMSLAAGCANIGNGRRTNTYGQSSGYGNLTGDQQSRLRAEVEDSQQEIERLERELTGQKQVHAIAEQRIENFREENQRLHQELTGTVLSTAGGPVRGGGAITPVAASLYVGTDLPSDIRKRLVEFTRSFKGVEYDTLHRSCRLQSDLTFMDGGDQLRPEARAALKELAAILNQSAVSNLNLQIVGYAGSASIPRELAAQHPTAWHLASHQAIAVEQYLEEQGIAAVRMGTVSYADQQPLVDGKDETAQRRNARVEVFILPPDPPAEEPAKE